MEAGRQTDNTGYHFLKMLLFDFETMSMKLSHIHCLSVLLMVICKDVVILNICRVTALAFQNNFSVSFKIFSISLLLPTVRMLL